MAEIRELFEKFRGGDRGGFEELIATITLMQGQLDPNSFIAGMLLGRGMGRSSDRMAALLPLILSMSGGANAQQQTGTATTNPLQMLLPLLFLTGREDWDDRVAEKYEIVERGPAARSATKGG